MLGIRQVLSGSGLGVTLFSFTPNLGATYVTSISRLVNIGSLHYLC
jgi:hypothetical protein